MDTVVVGSRVGIAILLALLATAMMINLSAASIPSVVVAINPRKAKLLASMFYVVVTTHRGRLSLTIIPCVIVTTQGRRLRLTIIISCVVVATQGGRLCCGRRGCPNLVGLRRRPDKRPVVEYAW